jgi:hypothetical protein
MDAFLRLLVRYGVIGERFQTAGRRIVPHPVLSA